MADRDNRGRASAGSHAQLIDLGERVRTPEVRRLLAMAVAGPDSSSREEIAEFFAQSPDRILFGWVDDAGIQGIVGGRWDHPPVLELLVLAVREESRHRGIGRLLVEGVADRVGALAIHLETDGAAVGFWERCGFSIRLLERTADGVDRFRVERRHPPEPPGFRTSPRVRPRARRTIEVELPPPGNTLPLVPEVLSDEDLPAFVLRWILDADEIGLMMQHLDPDLMPPVTPAVRPSDWRSVLGPSTWGVGLDHRVTAEGDEIMPGLPTGVEIPMGILERVEMSERIGHWLREAHRVHRWAEAKGHGDEPWIIPQDGMV